ncbi:MAG: hypothetical protein HYZ14_11115 [Bacteroidetes bacterium]|nr:hypothetical protein [Bacteroidota bacterium]
MKSLLPFLALFIQFCAFSQPGKTVYFHVDKLTLKNKIVSDSTFARRYKEKAAVTFSMQGYTGLSITDSVVKSEVTHYYFSYTGHFEKIILIRQRQHDTEKIKPQAHNDYTATLKSINKQIILLENSGFPFAAVRITDQQEEKNKLTLTYQIDSGQFFIIDKITIKSKEKFHEPTLLNIINLEAGEIYNESKIAAIGDLLTASKLYKPLRPVEVVFRNGKAEVFLFIEKEKSSDADGYVGFQQDKVTSKLALNGYINLSLQNAFNRSESLQMNWKNNPDKTQNLKLQFEYPYILKTPVGVGTRLNLQKQDSSFVRADSYFDLSYLQPYYRFGVYYQLESSTALLTDLPTDLRDYKKNTFGLSVRYNPKMPVPFQFYHPVISASGGFFNYRADSVDLNSNDGSNAKYSLRYSHVIDFLRYFHLNNSIQYDGLTASTPLSRNELIFFGGLRSIRGFYELELTGNDVVIVNNEIEFAPVSVISFKLLYDYASYQNAGSGYAQAVGFGFAFLTGTIKLEIILANGWQNDNAPNLSNTKIHLGFKSSF